MKRPKMQIWARSSQESRELRYLCSMVPIIVGSAQGEVGEQEEHSEDAGVDEVEPREGDIATATGGRSVHGWSVLDGCSCSMARIFKELARSGSVIAQVAAGGAQVAGDPSKGR